MILVVMYWVLTAVVIYVMKELCSAKKAIPPEVAAILIGGYCRLTELIIVILPDSPVFQSTEPESAIPADLWYLMSRLVKLE
ncbi:MAG: hypothetical protein BWY68_00968 [bacterium ADurb.Bin400]|nr:MAG: hypothetical protein BWY68_00968 [bacterium ADurb.Bin400]